MDPPSAFLSSDGASYLLHFPTLLSEQNAKNQNQSTNPQTIQLQSKNHIPEFAITNFCTLLQFFSHALQSLARCSLTIDDNSYIGGNIPQPPGIDLGSLHSGAHTDSNVQKERVEQRVLSMNPFSKARMCPPRKHVWQVCRLQTDNDDDRLRLC